MSALRAIALVVLCNVSLLSLAELPSEYVRRSWRSEDGLPQNTVSTILQAHDGYIWIGTQAGIARFDGMRFVVFNTQNTSQLPSNRITALLEDHQGHLWIGTAGGLVLMQDSTFTAFTKKDGLSSDSISALAEDDSGKVWIGTDYGLNLWRNGQFSKFTTQQALPNNTIKALYKSKDGGLWIGTNGGVSHFSSGVFTTYSVQQGLPSNFTRSIYEDPAGRLWVGTSRDLARLEDGRFVVYTAKQGLHDDSILAIYQDHYGHLWLGTNGSGLFQLVGGKFVPYRTGNKTRAEVVETVYEDRQGNLWLGTEGNGLVRLSMRRFITYNMDSGLSHDVVWSVTEDKHNNLWIATNDGLDELHEGRLAVYTTKDGLASNSIVSAYADREGDVWVGTTRGLTRFHDGKFTDWGRRFFKNSVLVLYQDRAGNIWAGGGDGLVQIKNGKVVAQYAARDGLTHPVRALAEDREGRLWIGMNGGGVSTLENHQLLSANIQGELSSDIVSSIFADREDTIWIGTDGGGLNRVKGGIITRYSTRDGLPDDSIYTIVEDSAQTLWMTSSRGIFRISKKQLSDFAAGKLAILKPEVYDASDGIINSVGTAGVQPGSWQATDGTLWFSTLGGVVKVDPRRLRGATALPPVVIENVIIDGKSFPIDRALELPSGHNNVAFDYTAFDFAAPQKVHFRYKLEGYDQDWTDGGTRRTAFYTNLAPGSYRFRVLASNSGTWSESGASASLYLKPHFYQTSCFYTLCASFLLLCGIGLHALRTKRLQGLAWHLARAVDERTKALEAQTRQLKTEIEEREKAQEDLRRAEQKYRSIFEQAVVGIFQSSPAGRYLSVNAAMAQMLGYDSPEELVATVTDLATQIYVDPKRREEFERLLKEEGIVRNFECQIYRKDGSKMWVAANVRMVQQDGIVCYEGTNQDISERKRLEAQLLQSQKMEAVGRLAGGVAHDFNNTIGVIVGYASLLKEQLLTNSRLQRYVEEISKASHRAASLTRQLLAFSRKQVIQPKILDLNLVVADTEKMLRRLIGEDIEMKVVRDPELGRIKADQAQIEQILMNLAVNARDAMPQGGTLLIETTNAQLDEGNTRQYPYAKPGPYVMLGVSDTGCGMDKETQHHIFEPFFTTKGPGQGTGLGLSTVYGIVKQNDGYIWVDSEPGKGARFTVYIPQVEDAVQSVAPFDEPALLAGSEIILLVEDDESMRLLTRSYLQAGGYTVLDVRDGESAIGAVSHHEGPIHLLLTDVVMPGVSGHQLAKSLAISKPEMKVLYMSGYTADVISRHGILDTGITLVEKPFTKQDLLRKVRQVLDRESLSRTAATM